MQSSEPHKDTVIVPSHQVTSSMSDVVADVLDEMLGALCSQCSSKNLRSERFPTVGDSFRNLRQRSDEEESLLNDSTMADDSDEDSEEEFNRILETTRAKWKEECDINDEYEESSVARKESFAIEREYDGMPQLERLTIHVEQDVPLKPLGSVVSVVDCLVVVQANSNIALDFDTVLFDHRRNAIGKVYDILGAVSAPLYAIRFNTPHEANSHEVGMEIFYAPTVEEFTRHVFTEQLRKERITDPCWDGEGECPEDELVFSDDEAEKRYKAKHRCKKISTSSNPNKKEEESERKRRRHEKHGVTNEHVGSAWRGKGRGMAQSFPSRGFSNPAFSSSMARFSSTGSQRRSTHPQRQQRGRNDVFYGGAPSFSDSSTVGGPPPYSERPRPFNPAFGGPPRFDSFRSPRPGFFTGFGRSHGNYRGCHVRHPARGQAQRSIKIPPELVDTRLVEQ
uniref:H/ACA ribonucleoprotein complex non-core subunit NAF1 n=1 Tax=Ascaris suum TaxID=6253 RepID=F1KVX3_ASCSU